LRLTGGFGGFEITEKDRRIIGAGPRQSASIPESRD
jgi:hypothetical protein